MADDHEIFNNKRTDKYYVSRAFPEASAGEATAPPRMLRILSHVFEGNEGLEYAKVKQEIVLRRTPKERFELKICFLQDSRDVQSITLQKFTIESGKPHKLSFSLSGEEIGRLYDALQLIKYICLESEEKQRIDDSVINAWQMTPTELSAFIQAQLTAEILSEIALNDLTVFDVAMLAKRKRELATFEQLLNDDAFFLAMQQEWKARGPESVWQKFFEANPWIFGYGLRYVFTTGLEDRKLEQVTTGFNFNHAGKRVDALLKTQGFVNALCFVELKTHRTELLDHKPYRDECWQVSSELAGSVAQIQKTVKRAEQEFRSRIELQGKFGDPTGEVLFAYAPKAYVVIGSLEQFASSQGINEQKYSSFELFRRNLVNPEIITYDELFERAKFIVAQSESSAEVSSPDTQEPDEPPNIEDIPF